MLLKLLSIQTVTSIFKDFSINTHTLCALYFSSSRHANPIACKAYNLLRLSSPTNASFESSMAQEISLFRRSLKHKAKKNTMSRPENSFSKNPNPPAPDNVLPPLQDLTFSYSFLKFKVSQLQNTHKYTSSAILPNWKAECFMGSSQYMKPDKNCFHVTVLLTRAITFRHSPQAILHRMPSCESSFGVHAHGAFKL